MQRDVQNLLQAEHVAILDARERRARTAEEKKEARKKAKIEEGYHAHLPSSVRMNSPRLLSVDDVIAEGWTNVTDRKLSPRLEDKRACTAILPQTRSGVTRRGLFISVMGEQTLDYLVSSVNNMIPPRKEEQEEWSRPIYIGGVAEYLWILLGGDENWSREHCGGCEEMASARI